MADEMPGDAGPDDRTLGSDPHEEIARLTAALHVERRNAHRWQELAEERRVALERIRQHPAIRLLLALTSWVRPVAHRLSRMLRRSGRTLGRIARIAYRAPDKVLARRRKTRLEDRLVRLPEVPRDPREVSIIILTRNGHERLADLLPSLRDVEHQHVEIIVYDNASESETRNFLAAQEDVRVLRSETNLSFAAANNEAAEAATGSVLCFLNDDVVPATTDWLSRMLVQLKDPRTVVGAQLVYPLRGLTAARTRDLTVQHLGIQFLPRPDGGVPEAVNVRAGLPDPELPPRERSAVTGACLLLERDAFEAAGGFDPGYQYGVEDVDLCWRLRREGGISVVAPDAVLYHHEGSTRHREHPRTLRERQRANWVRFESKFGPELRREVEIDRLLGRASLTDRPYRVGITVTRDLAEAGYGDWYTAHELGHEFERFGWQVTYLERYRHAWYEPPDDLDSILVLHDLFDVRRVQRHGLTTLAWVRNWVDRWIGQPWFDDLDVVLASSRAAVEHIAEETRHEPSLMPLATNPARFRSGDEERSGVVFTGNHWGEDRGIRELARALPELIIYGKGWEGVNGVAERWRGHVSYDELPGVYRRAAIVVDQTASPTSRYATLNARVFDALAAGALVVTDQSQGADELFDGRLPTYRDPQDLARTVRNFLSDPPTARGLVEVLRGRVLAEHTYEERARQIRQLLLDRAAAPHISLKTGCPDRQVAHTWGDWHLADAFARELRVRGCTVRLETRQEWSDPASRSADIAVHLKGRGRAPQNIGQMGIVWIISHPEELTDDEMAEADLLLAGGERLADELRLRTSTPVEVFRQATDERRFRPFAPDPVFRHEVAFVGNSKFTFRKAVRDALACGLQPAIYGANWERYVAPDLIRSSHVPNERLPVLYSSVGILLNDHWPDMRRTGLLSNRIFDALACGTVVVSDAVDELDEVFGSAVATFQGPEDLCGTVEALLSDPARRREMAAEGRRAVLANHTFSHRAERFLGLVDDRREAPEEMDLA